jgi:NTP pyrophosphatase (non-canonical NTP hydrolase)
MKRGISGATIAAMTTSTRPDSLTELRDLTRQFARDRDWKQFHTPKNLAMALSVEVSELAEHYQWLRTGAESELNDEARTGIRHELADVLLYLVQLADKHHVDLHAAALEKMQLNAIKYPTPGSGPEFIHELGR